MLAGMHSSSVLNDQQEAAVHHIEGPLLVLAGAGSGKTRVVTHRVAHLIQIGVPVGEIVAVTFTNKAAGEMRERILHMTQRAVLTCTFHSLCARILRESISVLGYSPQFTIYDEEDSLKVLKECLVALDINEEKNAIKAFRQEISNAKNRVQAPEDFADNVLKASKPFAKIYPMYQQRLRSYDALDFDDLLFLTVQLFQKHPEVLERYQNLWRFILIDEYQDTNAAQYQLIRLLSANHQNVFAVGDPDQSIYSWRGANIQNILNFQKDFPGAQVISLEQNYRSRSNILEAANAVIQHNCSRYEKNLWSLRGEGEKIHLFIGDNEQEEIHFVLQRLNHLTASQQIPLHECAIFYRTHFQSRLFEDAFLKRRIPYKIIGGQSFYQRREIKDILAFLRMILGGSDYLAFARTINLPKRGIGETTLHKLRDLAYKNQWDILTTCTQVIAGKAEFIPTGRQRAGLEQYVDMIRALQAMVRAQLPLSEVIASAIERSHYFDYLKEDPETFQERKENVNELLSKATEWVQEHPQPTLAGFLEELTLKTTAEDSSALAEGIRLMTFHNGKGLEFSAVFLVGMEEDLFPHLNSKEDAHALEEERRLCYVGMTRAKEYLHLSAARYRLLWGIHRTMYPSRFLKEIPRHFLYAYAPKEDSVPSEYSDSFRPGDRVFHRDFGEGTVQRAYQTSFGITYDVLFDEPRSTRSLVAKFARLTLR